MHDDAQFMPRPTQRLRRRIAACLLPVVLAACGGGSSDAGNTCTVADQQDWLRGNFNANYFWYALAPNPSPAGFITVDGYFDALLYQGGGPIPGGGGALWPSDRYSGFQSTESFERFFGAGQTMGYGLAVAGLEVIGQPTAPLFVRYLEPGSPAAAAGIVRGDRVLSLNGRTAAELITANDFSLLSPNAVGERLTIVLRSASGAQRAVELAASVFALTPVQGGRVLQTLAGRKLGYVFVKDMLDQANGPLGAVMADFRAQGIQELVLDLRYNGGGFVSVGGTVASYAAGNRGAGQVYTRLLYNDKNQGSNQRFDFGNPAAWNGFARVYVLMGERTCSASEQVINGLRGVGVNVVAVGDTSCGKPVGFNARGNGCGTHYSIVNFEGVNARNEGRYFNGFAPTCAVAEDFGRPIGDVNDPLLTTTAHHIDNGACPVTASAAAPRAKALSASGGVRSRYRGADGGERVGMTTR
jgi:carboxyl-terminal processing protease